MSARHLLILDADGVFMNEMPYWRTALAVGLVRYELAPADEGVWRALEAACLDTRLLPRLTKRRGCNSNWEMAAVLVQAMGRDGVPGEVGAALQREDYAGCAELLAGAMEDEWRGRVNGAAPLSGFGISRQDRVFTDTVALFHDIFIEQRDIGWPYARHELAAPPEATRSALARLAGGCADLAVCTSRMASEIEPPMRALEILGYFDSERIVTSDDAKRGQAVTGVKGLGKPHWFGPAVAACGFDAAVAAVRDEAAPLTPRSGGRTVYVGDAPADHMAAVAAKRRGLGLDYVHIDSGVSGDELISDIGACEQTLGVCANLSEAADVLAEILA